ncbi:tubulin-specific chaperone C-like [Octopus sinensis]|uniref:Tubulin-specific chaperone C-like n=1 Tax=Octopus sinensis TaxID=2607531 RepID=A0A6P7TS00_9MOLL|nr:tubulin-specific chaperone C-like [Octopus sinensis]XP_029656567.1 tubulin-specific chaperone C-like [Octopus sinensis]
MCSNGKEIDKFEQIFLNKIKTISEGISQISESEDHLDQLSNEIDELIKYTTNSLHFIPAFTIRKRLTEIKALQNKLEIIRQKRLSHKKFNFKSTLNTKKSPKNIQKTSKILVEESFGFHSRQNETLTLFRDELVNKNIVLKNLKNCHVYLFGPMAGIQLIDLESTRVHSGPVSSSVLAQNCRECHFYVACLQLRISFSRDCRFNSHVGNRAVLENSSGIGFGDYSYEYEGVEEDFEFVGLRKGESKYAGVDDFNWLNQQEKSPNYYFFE